MGKPLHRADKCFSGCRVFSALVYALSWLAHHRSWASNVAL